MIDNCGIALDNAVNAQVASEPSIGNLLVLKALDCSFDGNGSISSGL
jgi:hypothetical protein